MQESRDIESRPMRVVIADDERLARSLLRSLLGSMPEVAVVAECNDGASTIKAISELEPDVIFLDIEMPGTNGMAVVNHFAGGPKMPYVIFVTAYSKFACEAFELNAVDYVVKPISKERLEASVKRAEREIRKDSAVILTKRLLELAADTTKSVKARPDEERIILKKHGTLKSLSLNDIVWVEAANQYVNIYTLTDRFIMSESLSHFGERLTDERFVRVHRSAIVNGHFIARIDRIGNGSHTIYLENGIELTLARSRSSLIPTLLQLADVRAERSKTSGSKRSGTATYA